MVKVWFLEHIAVDGTHVRRRIERLPFRIGREPALNDYAVVALQLSRQHATLDEDRSGHLLLTDHNSTNGSTVNGQPVVGSCLVKDQDVINLGDAVFRLSAELVEVTVPLSGFGNDDRTMIRPKVKEAPRQLSQHERDFREVLAGVGVAIAVQPIVDLNSRQTVAYEMLGRCRHPKLLEPPGRLFYLAEQLGLEAELSAAFCRHGIPLIAPRLNGAQLFINAHPKETFTEAFFQSLKTFRELPSAPRIVVELHETAVVEIDEMHRFTSRLADIGLEFAFDDYGVGQSRMDEIEKFKPDFVKFDKKIVDGIAQADARRQDYIRKNVELVRSMNVICLAEGVESDEDGRVCRDMGFQLIQGYLTGKPTLVE